MTLYCVVEIKKSNSPSEDLWTEIHRGSEGWCWIEYQKVRKRQSEHLLPIGPFDIRMRRIHSALVAQDTVCET